KNVRPVDRPRIFLAICLLLPIMSLGQVRDRPADRPVKAFSTKNRTVTIYTTADSTDLKLALTGTVDFRELRQSLENQISVFVNPAKIFQSFLGIGGAITDASAEVFAKLPAAKQQ